MDNVKNDAYYLEKLLDDLKTVTERMQGVTKADLSSDTVLCDAVLFRIVQISETSEKLSASFKEAHPAIPWKAIRGMRNRIVHEYGNVDLEIVFVTASEDIPRLYEELQR